MANYNRKFYERNKRFQMALADKISHFVANKFKPKSIVDFGCGCGYFLKNLAELAGTTDFVGLNFPVPRAITEIDVTEVDLSESIYLGKRFDLVVSLEVAEHVAESSADMFIENLTAHGDTILFSAATPGQGGEGHENEQPHEYWHKKFEFHGYEPRDIIRPIIRGDKSVPFWYRENIFVYKRGIK